MKFSIPMLALAASALGADSSDVFDLTAADFDAHIKSHDLVLAEFFAPWCGHCKNLAPEYEEAASTLKNRSEDITLAKIDCVDNMELCQEHQVEGFPTLLIFENGAKTGQYSGARKAEDIANYMVKRAQPVVIELTSAKEVDTWLSDNQDPIVLLYLGPKSSRTDFDKIAQQKRERLTFIASEDKALRKRYDGDVVAIRRGEDANILPVDAELDEDTLAKFVTANEFPTFGELGPETYSAYISSGVPMLYAFVESPEHRELFISALQPHAKALAGEANIVFLNATQFGMHADNVNLRQEFPAMVVHDVVTNKKYVHNQDTPISVKSVAEFVKKYLAGEIESNLKSEPVPESQDEPVHYLVGSQYDEIVLDDDKDVLVEFYAPWCGHCKNLAPIYDQLGELYQENPKVTIAKIDQTLNEVPDKITGFPTIKLYRAGKKDEPLTYNGERTLEDLSAFIEKEGLHKSSGSSAGKKVEKAEMKAKKVVNEVKDKVEDKAKKAEGKAKKNVKDAKKAVNKIAKKAKDVAQNAEEKVEL